MRRTYLAVSVAADTTDAARRVLERCAGKADLAELRLDLMRSYDLKELLRDRPLPVIVTNRAAWEGGGYTGVDSRRMETLLEAAALGAEHIDVELLAADRLAGANLGSTGLILSSHDYETTPDLAAAYAACLEAGADIAKVVGTAVAPTDPIAALNLLKHAYTPTIALTMGELGLISRVLAFRYGAYLSFAAPDSAEATAPGQVSLTAMLGAYGVRSIDGDTRVIAWLVPQAPHIGDIEHGNHALREQGLNAVLIPLVVDSLHVTPVVEAYKAFGLDGFVLHEALRDRAAGAPPPNDPLGATLRTNLLLKREGYWANMMVDEPVLPMLPRIMAGR